MRVFIVTGGRDRIPSAREMERFEDIICGEDAVAPRENTIIFVGDATGVDAYIIKWCQEHGYQYARFDALWQFHKKAGGPIRNGWMSRIGNEVDATVLAFRGGIGTKNCMEQARERGLFIIPIGWEGK